MRISPASKKKVDMDRFIESRVLISSSTINPFSKNISTKLDLIKQEISREYHEKYPTQKKRATSGKKTASNNKTKVFENKEIDSVRRKLNFNDPPPLYHTYEPLQRTPNQAVYYQNNNSNENANFRERYYELQDKLISEKRKMIEEFEKQSLFKQKVIDFLEEPSNDTANEIKQYFTTQRQKKIIEKFLSMVQDIEYAEKTLSQLLGIVEVEDTETLIQQLKKRQSTYKNISECSFKLLELETAYNKLQKDSQSAAEESNIKVLRMQQKLKIQMEQMETNIRKITEQKEEQKKDEEKKMYGLLQKTLDRINQITYDLSQFNTRRTHKSKSIENSEVHRQSSMQQIQLSKQSLRQNKIDNILRKIEEKFEEIQLSFLGILNQSEINTQKIMSSKEDIQRLQFLLQKITYENEEEKLKLIEHFEERTKQIDQQFNCQKRNLQEVILNLQHKQQTLNNEIKAKEEEINLLRQSFATQNQQFRQKLDKKQTTLRKVIKTICDVTEKSIEIFQLEDISSSQKTKTFNHYQPYYNLSLDMDETIIHNVKEILNDHFSVLKGSLQSAENMVLWHEKEIQIKEGLLKQFDFNLKKMMQQLNTYQEKEKGIQFERDQYKYLLNSLRENVREMKKDHEEALAQIAKDKDQQYLNSNRDILVQNQRLNNQLKAFHRSINDLTDQLKSESNSHSFFKKKSDQLQLSLSEVKQKLGLSQTQALKYKNHLVEIEQSFKQVENMSQINSQKLIVLEQQNKYKGNEMVELRSKVNSLLAQISEKDENYIKISRELDDLKIKYNKTYTAKEDLEYENTNIRFKNLEIARQSSENIEKLKAVQIQNTKLGRQNKKLLEEVNSLTNKLLKYLNQKTLVNKTRKEVRQVFQQQIKSKLNEMKDEYRKNKLLIKNYLSQSKTLITEESKEIKRQIQEYCKYQQSRKMAERKEWEKEKEDRNFEGEKGKIIMCKKQLSFVRDNVLNCREYCKYVKLEFQEQVNSILKLFESPSSALSSQQSKMGQHQITLMKMKLCLNSLRNQSHQLRSSFQGELRNFQSLFQIPYSVRKPINKIQQFNEIDKKINSKDKDDVNYIKPANPFNEKVLQIEIQEFPTPQFGKFKKVDHRRKRYELANDEQQEIQQDFIQEEEQESSNQVSQNKNNLDNLESSYQQKIFSERVERDVQIRNLKDIDYVHSKKGEVPNNQMSWSGVKPNTDQIQRVMKILVSLKNNQIEEPKIPYFNYIKKEFQAVKNRIVKNILDISGISFRNNTISSPSSANFSKQFLFDKRFNTQPNQEMGGTLSLAIKQTNRSQYKYDNAISPLLKQNEELKQQIQRIDEQLKIYEYREQQYKITISELQKQKIQLQNEASKQMKEKLILKLITDICKQNWKDVQNSCKILLKLMKLTPHQINEKVEAFKAFISKYQKKNSGFMSGLFKNNKT